jgi:hypothetical protein
MSVSLEGSQKLKAILEIPAPDCHIVTSGENEGLRWMHGNRTNIIRMGFEGCDFLRSEIVVYPQLEVIGACNEPILELVNAKSSGRSGGSHTLRAIKRPARTGTSHSSKLFTMLPVSYDL